MILPQYCTDLNISISEKVIGWSVDKPTTY